MSVVDEILAAGPYATFKDNALNAFKDSPVIAGLLLAAGACVLWAMWRALWR